VRQQVGRRSPTGQVVSLRARAWKFGLKVGQFGAATQVRVEAELLRLAFAPKFATKRPF